MTKKLIRTVMPEYIDLDYNTLGVAAKLLNELASKYREEVKIEAEGMTTIESGCM